MIAPPQMLFLIGGSPVYFFDDGQQGAEQVAQAEAKEHEHD